MCGRRLCEVALSERLKALLLKECLLRMLMKGMGVARTHRPRWGGQQIRIVIVREC